MTFNEWPSRFSAWLKSKWAWTKERTSVKFIDLITWCASIAFFFFILGMGIMSLHLPNIDGERNVVYVNQKRTIGTRTILIYGGRKWVMEPYENYGVEE